MLSSNGKDKLAPRPRNTARRDRCFFVMNMAISSNRSAVVRDGGRSRLRRALTNDPLLKWRACDDAENERRPAVVVARLVAHEVSHRGGVPIVETAAERVRQQHLGERPGELITLAQQGFAKRLRAVDAGTPKGNRGVDGRAVVVLPPFADRVEVFQREPEWIHRGMAARAHG